MIWEKNFGEYHMMEYTNQANADVATRYNDLELVYVGKAWENTIKPKSFWRKSTIIFRKTFRRCNTVVAESNKDLASVC